ncbi:MAG TPA: Flp family type IVb pilin [Alphaproteobacteria bacterium]|nr:Flp family type IVb pilin [Alphaproteobacteria bacterium]
MTFLKNFLRQDEGVTAIEYGLIAALIALLIIAGVTAIGQTLKNTFSSIASQI